MQYGLTLLFFHDIWSVVSDKASCRLLLNTVDI